MNRCSKHVLWQQQKLQNFMWGHLWGNVLVPIYSRLVTCWNLMESYPSRITLIGLSHKWTRILLTISNTKLERWIFSQTTIYVNSQFNFYGVITLEHTRLCPGLHLIWSPATLQITYSEHIIYIVPSVHDTFWKIYSGKDVWKEIYEKEIYDLRWI